MTSVSWEPNYWRYYCNVALNVKRITTDRYVEDDEDIVLLFAFFFMFEGANNDEYLVLFNRK